MPHDSNLSLVSTCGIKAQCVGASASSSATLHMSQYVMISIGVSECGFQQCKCIYHMLENAGRGRVALYLSGHQL